MSDEYQDSTKFSGTYSIVEHTNEWITRSKFRAKRMLTLYPSEASVAHTDENNILRVEGTCMRAAYFRATGEPGTPFNARSERIMSVGKSIEEWFIARWKEMGIWVDNNVKFYWAEYNISGELDCILTDPSTGDLYGVEAKTFYGYEAAKEIFGNKKLAGFPKINHLLQTLIYTYFFRDKLKYFKMVYMDRGDCRTREFKVELQEISGRHYPVIDGTLFTKFSVEDILERYKMLNYHVSNAITPPRDYELVWDTTRVELEKSLGNVSKTAYEQWKKGKRKIGDWNCNYCAYKSTCWGLNEAPVDEEVVEETEENSSSPPANS